MGLSISWIAVNGVAKDELLARLNLADSRLPDPENRAKLSFAELSSGWLLIYSRNFNYASPKRVAAASANGVAIGCAIEEHVMVSSARAYRNGEALWSVTHDPDKGLDNLAMEGALPPEASAIRARLLRQLEEGGGEASDVDYLFEAPLELSEAICGFKHDQAPEDGPLAFTELEGVLPPKAPGRGILQRIGALLGRS